MTTVVYRNTETETFSADAVAVGVAMHLNALMLAPRRGDIEIRNVDKIVVEQSDLMEVPTDIQSRFLALQGQDSGRSDIWKSRYVQYRLYSYLLSSVYSGIKGIIEVVPRPVDRFDIEFTLRATLDSAGENRNRIREVAMGDFDFEEKLRKVFERASNSQIEGLSLGQESLLAGQQRIHSDMNSGFDSLRRLIGELKGPN